MRSPVRTKNSKKCVPQRWKSDSTLPIWCRQSSKRMSWERRWGERQWSRISLNLTNRSSRTGSVGRLLTRSTTQCSALSPRGSPWTTTTAHWLSMRRAVCRWLATGSSVARSRRSEAPRSERSCEDRCWAMRREEGGRRKRMTSMGRGLTSWSGRCRNRMRTGSRSRRRCTSRWWRNNGTIWSKRSKSSLISTASSNHDHN